MPEKKTKTKKIEVKKPRIVEQGNFSVVLTSDELFSMIQVLSFSREVFSQMAYDCKTLGDDRAATVWGARSELSYMLFKKFRDVAEIGEPVSNEVH